MKCEFVTIESCQAFRHKGLANPVFTIRATQEYDAEHDCGHYKYVITDEHGNIHKAMYSCGAAREGKIDGDFLQEELKSFGHDYKQNQSFLKWGNEIKVQWVNTREKMMLQNMGH